MPALWCIDFTDIDFNRDSGAEFWKAITCSGSTKKGCMFMSPEESTTGGRRLGDASEWGTRKGSSGLEQSKRMRGSRRKSESLKWRSYHLTVSNLQLHIEQLSLRWTWRQADWLLYNRGCKERTTLGLIGGEKWSSWDLNSWWVTQRTWEYHRLRESSQGLRGSRHTLDTAVKGSDTWKTSPLVGLKTREVYERVVRNPESVLRE